MKNTSSSNSIPDELLKSLAPSQRNNLSVIQAARSHNGGVRFQSSPGRDVSERPTIRMSIEDLNFAATSGDVAAEWQVLGTIDFSPFLTEQRGTQDTEWIDLVCVVRLGVQYSILPVMLEQAEEEEEEFTGVRTRLVLHREPNADLPDDIAEKLRVALETPTGKIEAAYTPTANGLFVAFLFDIGDK